MSNFETNKTRNQQEDDSAAPACLVDADACPVCVRQTLESLTRRHGLRLIYFVDENHELYPSYGEVCQIEQGNDAVDYALIAKVRPGDVVVTQDYGLASLVLAKRAYAIHPNGNLYDLNTIDQLLMERHLASRARRAGERTQRSRKPANQRTMTFEKQMSHLLNQISQLPGHSD